MKSRNMGFQNSGIGSLDILVKTAANEDFSDAKDTEFELKEQSNFLAHCCQMLDAPEDLPMGEMAFIGLSIAIRFVEQELFGATLVADRVARVTTHAVHSAAAGATLMALRGRMGRHLLYAIAINIGNATKKEELIDKDVLAITGAWFLQRLLAIHDPTSSSIAKAMAVVARPKSKQASSWSSKARLRGRARAFKNLNDAIHDNPKVAMQFGMINSRPRLAQANDPISIVNREYRRRVKNLYYFAEKNAIGAAGGHGTLPAASLLEAGRELMNRVKTGDAEAAMICLEIVSHLTSQNVLKIPLKTDSNFPDGALLWLDLCAGEYCQTLFELVEKGARPAAGSDHIYETTTQTVKTKISPPLTEFLVNRLVEIGGTANSVAQLLLVAPHHARSAVVGSGVYRISARKMQESLPALLLEAGHHRWPVALATNSPFLVSLKRSIYGACPQHKIDEVVNAGHELLGWPISKHKVNSCLVGSFTTPRPGAVAYALNFLVDEADQSIPPVDFTGIIQSFNRHAQWLSLVLALGFALRRWLHYTIPAAELLAGFNVHLDDKNVHEHKGAPVPTATFVYSAMLAWMLYCQSVITNLKSLDEQRALNLANTIAQHLADACSETCVFTLDAVDRIEPVGCHTWGDELPANIRLRPSFSRQFWPLQLLERNVPQSLIDILLRHQVPGMHPGSSHSLKKNKSNSDRLKKGMDEVLASLNLRIPKNFEMVGS